MNLLGRGGEGGRSQGTLFVKQATISFDFFSPFWTVDNYLSIIGQLIFFVQCFVCFFLNLPEIRCMNIK